MSLLTTLLESSGATTNGLMDFRGSYDASVNTFPATGGSGASGAILKGDFWLVSVGGTLGGSVVSVGDTIFATVDTPGQTAGNWAVLEGNIGYTPENVANKDATGGYVGLTLFKINFKNVANTFTSFFTNSNTAARTYTFQDRNGTIADDTDLALKAALASPTFTGVVTIPSLTQPFVSLTDAATVAVDLSLSSNFNLVTTSGVGATRALGIPTNVAAGKNGVIAVRQDSSGSRALTYTWPYIFTSLSAPVISLGKGAMDLLSYIVLSYSTATATMTIATPCVVTWTGHGLSYGQRVAFTTTGALPTGLAVNTGYYINVIDANTFNLSSSLANLQAGTYIATSGSQSGTHTATNMAIEITANLNNGA